MQPLRLDGEAVAPVPGAVELPGRLGAPPERAQGICESFRFDAVGRVEMVALFEHFEVEVRKDVAQSGRDGAVLVGVAESAEGEVDGAVEAGKGIPIEVVTSERLEEGADAGWALCHPGGWIAGWR